MLQHEPIVLYLSLKTECAIASPGAGIIERMGRPRAIFAGRGQEHWVAALSAKPAWKKRTGQRKKLHGYL